MPCLKSSQLPARRSRVESETPKSCAPASVVNVTFFVPQMQFDEITTLSPLSRHFLVPVEALTGAWRSVGLDERLRSQEQRAGRLDVGAGASR
jgi:hypothetical protein